MYHQVAILKTTSGGPFQATWETAIYFSLVTWTTLGYGDYQPSTGYQLLAGIEAIFGYVYLGLIVGLLGKAFDP